MKKTKQILVLKNKMTELKDSIESFNSGLGQAEERISELADTQFKINQKNERERIF
jgi:uncharacterized phage infection (PIP) family protein YhgE